MKKNNTKSIILIITLITCLLMGCSNEATQAEVEPVEQEPTVKVEETTVEEPEIIIFNGVELYMIHMKEGQHYQLKPDDKIIVNREGSLIGCGWEIDLGDTSMSIDNYNILKVDYSKFEQHQKFFFSKRNENDEKIVRTCYFDPPTE